jgi:hypothetical protein
LQLKTEETTTTKPVLATLARAKTGAGQGLWRHFGVLAILGIAAYLVAQWLLGPVVPAHKIVRQEIVQTVVARLRATLSKYR